MEKAILLSMGYFTMATELRLLFREGEEEEGEGEWKWDESECYHLLAIIAVVHFVPFDLAYLQSILQSYTTHYQRQLNRQHYSPLTPSEMLLALT